MGCLKIDGIPKLQLSPNSFKIMGDAFLLEDFQPGELLCDKGRYRTKFDVYFSEWNPHMDLLALASKKGNVIVKRLQWKTGWKVDFDKEDFLSDWKRSFDATPCTSLSSTNEKRCMAPLAGLCWSPNGQILLVTFENGDMYFLDAQNGRPLFFTTLGYNPNRLRWFEVEPASNFNFSQDIPIKPSSGDFDFVDGGLEKCAALINDLETFFGRVLTSSLLGTLLCVAHADVDDSEIIVLDILAGGFICLKQYNLCEILLQEYKGREGDVFPSTLEVLDLRINKQEGRVEVLCKYCAKNDDDSFGYKNSLLNLPFDFSEAVTKLIADATFSICQLAFLMAYVRELFLYSTHDWQAESEAFHRRVLYNMRIPEQETQIAFDAVPTRGEVFALCRDFLSMITTGVLSKSVQNYFVQDSVMKDLKLANGFVDSKFSALIKGISIGLRPAIQLSKQFLRSLEDTMDSIRSRHYSNGCFSSMFGFGEMDSSGGEEQVNATFFHDFQQYLTMLDKSLMNLSIIAEENRRNLKHFVRFLLMLCITQSDEIDDDKLAKEFEIQKVDLRTLSNFIALKFGRFEELNHSLGIGDNNSDVEFDFLVSYFNRIKPSSLTADASELDRMSDKPLNSLLDDVLAVLNDASESNEDTRNPINAINKCTFQFRRLLCGGMKFLFKI